jgi:hypothetical protein
MYKKKNRVQQENSYKITYCLRVCITNLILALHTQSVNGLLAGGAFLRQQKKNKVPPAHVQRVYHAFLVTTIRVTVEH